MICINNDVIIPTDNVFVNSIGWYESPAGAASESFAAGIITQPSDGAACAVQKAFSAPDAGEDYPNP